MAVNGGVPKEVVTLCRKEGVRPAEVIGYLLGDSQPCLDRSRACYWVVPVWAVLKDGREIRGEVIKFG